MSVNCAIFCINVPSPKECCNKEECCTITSLPHSVPYQLYQKNTVEKILGAEKIIGKEMVESGVNRKEAVNALFTIVVAQTTLPDMPAGHIMPHVVPKPDLPELVLSSILIADENGLFVFSLCFFISSQTEP